MAASVSSGSIIEVGSQVIVNEPVTFVASSDVAITGQRIHVVPFTMLCTSGMVANGVYKWDNDQDTSESWSPVNDTSETWTDVPDTSESWSQVGW